MKIGSLQRVSLIDYPGKIGATVFTQGCNFRCPYCHNPELVAPDRYGPLIPEDDIFSFLQKRRGKLEAVTVTGGEPTLHNTLGQFLGTVKDLGYLVKVDTNGSNPDALALFIKQGLVDYLAMDIKGPLERYGRIAAVPVDTSKIIRSIELITNSGIDHEFRTTVVRSQLHLQDLLSIVKLLNKASLYVLHPFIPQKTLDASFLSEASYSTGEFSSIREKLEKEGIRVEVR